MVYDSSRAAVLLLRRSDGALWQWDGVAGSWTPLAGLPTAWNSAAKIAYDKRRERLVAVASGGARWEWDSHTAAWMPATPGTPTPPLVNWLAYDSTAQSLISIGSWELWEWTAP